MMSSMILKRSYISSVLILELSMWYWYRFQTQRIEKDCWNNQTGDLVIFLMNRLLALKIKKIEKVCKYAKENGYKFEFLKT